MSYQRSLSPTSNRVIGSNDAGYTLDSYQLSRAPATDTRVFNELLLPSAPHVPVVYTAPFAPPRPVGDSPSPTSPSDSNSSSPPYDVSDLPSFPLLSNRVSRKGPNHIPRPPNAFIIFRSKFLEEQKDLKDIERDHRHVSRIAANTWKMFSKEEKDKYKRLAEQAKREHEARYPGYRFAPSRQREKHKRITKRNGPRDKVRAQCIAQLMAKGYRGAALRASVEELDAELDGLYGTGAESDPSGSDHVPSSNARETDAPPFQSPLLPPASSHSSPTGQVRFEPTTYLPLPESPPMASLQDPTVPPHGRLSLVTPSAFSYRELPSDCPPPPVSYFPALYPWSNQVTAAARTQLHLPSSSFGPEPAANDFWPSMDAAAPPLNVPEWQPAPADPSEFALVDFLAAEPNMNFDWNTAMH